MIKRIDKIIQSKTAPESNNVLWDDGENLKISRNGNWENTGNPIDPVVWKYMCNPFIIEVGAVVPDYLTQLLINDNPLILNLCKIKIEETVYDENAGANRPLVHFCTPIAWKYDDDDTGLALQCITFYNNAYHTYYAEVDICGSGEVYEIYEIS